MSVIENYHSLQNKINNIMDYFSLTKKPKILAVSKFQTSDIIIPLLREGHFLFGENRLQESLEKWIPLKEQYPQTELHFIGTIQSRKLSEICSLFDVVQTIDRIDLIKELVKIREKQGKLPKLFLQVNTGREEQKSGLLKEDIPQMLETAKNNNISFEGIMCIPPVDEYAGYHFSLMRSLSHLYNLPITSMGMSSDYKQAMICRSDYIRIGTSLFGERSQI